MGRCRTVRSPPTPRTPACSLTCSLAYLLTCLLLLTGTLSTYAADVFEKEPPPPTSPLLACK